MPEKGWLKVVLEEARKEVNSRPGWQKNRVTKTTHTPGPWFPIKDLNGANNRMLVCNDELYREYRIADCGYADNFKAEANARLIAKAPEMLELLETIENDNQQVPKWLWNRIQRVVGEAKGEL